ncbi:DUF1127 domain-containing protein [Pseudomonas sp. KNUC1026]|uniref:DUF1127 domain-containing protein n=1 Tax=Pseudomonas sp. KNUC1026 TaxID=2893890 RepID=UPI001F1C1740|nr:DUF1127 domain-containing protein [Pseudomonas sp. KNUC1026]UFH49501.1 DUF1127 domain-containing protein [Pseudomonas sp. KNUC1026]
MPRADEIALPLSPIAIERAPSAAAEPRVPYRNRFALFAFRWRSRRQLLELSDGQLKDLGLSRADAMSEGSKPFWLG